MDDFSKIILKKFGAIKKMSYLCIVKLRQEQ